MFLKITSCIVVVQARCHRSWFQRDDDHLALMKEILTRISFFQKDWRINKTCQLMQSQKDHAIIDTRQSFEPLMKIPSRESQFSLNVKNIISQHAHFTAIILKKLTSIIKSMMIFSFANSYHDLSWYVSEIAWSKSELTVNDDLNHFFV